MKRILHPLNLSPFTLNLSPLTLNLSPLTLNLSPFPIHLSPFPRHLLLLIFSLLSLTLQAQVATVIEDVTEVDYRSTHSSTSHRKTVVQVNNERGLRYAAFTVGCDANTALASFSGEVSYAAGGKPKKIKKSELLRSEYSSMLATDAYYYFYSPSPASYPFTVTYEWTVRCTDAVLCLDVFWPQPGFDVDVKHSSYSVVHDPDVPIHHASAPLTFHPSPFTSSLPDGRERLTLEVSDLPAVKEEHYMPLASSLFPHAYFVPSTFTFGSTSGSLSSWQTFGQWIGSLCEGRGVLPDALKAKLHALTDSCADPRERLLKVYRLLADETRYVSIQLGIGGMQPASAADVCRHGFGDCKGLSNLMVAMLREVGIEADYVVIGTKHEDLPSDFANPALLDHAICRAHMPDGDVWIECTDPQLPLGYVHSGIAGHEAVVISPPPAPSIRESRRGAGAAVVRLPRYSAAENVDSINIVVHLAADGSAQMEVDEVARETMYEVDRYLLDLDKDKQRDAIRSQLSLPHFSFAQHAVEQVDPARAELRVTYSGECQKYAGATGSRLFVPLLPYAAPSAPQPLPSHGRAEGGLEGEAARMNAVQYSRENFVRVYHLTLLPVTPSAPLQLPPSGGEPVPPSEGSGEVYEVEHLPAPLNVTTEFGSIEMTVRPISPSASTSPPPCLQGLPPYWGGRGERPGSWRGAGLIIDVRIECSRDVLPPDRYPALCAFVKQIADCLNGKIVLVRSGTKK